MDDAYQLDEYKYGFQTEIETEVFEKGLNEEVIRAISKKKGEPDFVLDFRLKAYKTFLEMTPPNWSHLNYPPIDLQNIRYFALPPIRCLTS
jgi:Fe-S cluster assembly protein SufB